jgi:hypothetical protein
MRRCSSRRSTWTTLCLALSRDDFSDGNPRDIAQRLKRDMATIDWGAQPAQDVAAKRVRPPSPDQRLGNLHGKTKLLDTLNIVRPQLCREFVPEAARHHFRHMQSA